MAATTLAWARRLGSLSFLVAALLAAAPAVVRADDTTTPGDDWVRVDGNWTGLGTTSPHGSFYRAELHHSGTAAFISSRNPAHSSVAFDTVVEHVLDKDPIALGRRYDDTNDDQDMHVRWQWILARKYASPAPQATLNDNEHGGPGD